MGEQPLFSCKAHVFQLEPELKKSWIALSTSAVNVQIFHDPIKNIYRIVSVEGSKALINSIVTPRMTFTKTSQKFGQWIDFKLNLVYGLGFANDVELNKFVEKFKEIKELTRNNTLKPHERSNSCEITTINRNINNNEVGHEVSEAQLKYENERLKMILAQSSASSRKWEDEIQALKLANSRLTNALQESNTNIDEWKKQLQFYKDECTRMRNINHHQHTNGNTNGNGNINGKYQNSNKYDDFDEVSSTSTPTSNNSFNKSTNGIINTNNTNNNNNNTNNKRIKQELVKLTENFDKKFKELQDIREQMRKLISEMN